MTISKLVNDLKQNNTYIKPGYHILQTNLIRKTKHSYLFVLITLIMDLIQTILPTSVCIWTRIKFTSIRIKFINLNADEREKKKDREYLN